MIFCVIICRVIFNISEFILRINIWQLKLGGIKNEIKLCKSCLVLLLTAIMLFLAGCNTKENGQIPSPQNTQESKAEEKQSETSGMTKGVASIEFIPILMDITEMK